MSQISRIGESGPSRVEYNPTSTNYSQTRLDIQEIPQRFRDNEVFNNLVETNGMASELETMLIGMLTPNDPALRIERDIERLLSIHELRTGLDLGATHGDLFAKAMITIREYYEFAGIVPGPDGSAQMTGIGHADVMQLRAEAGRGGVANFFARNLGIGSTAGALAGGAAGAGVGLAAGAGLAAGSTALTTAGLGGAAAIGSLAAATVGTGGLALFAVAGAAGVMGLVDMRTRHVRTTRLARIQTHLDNVSSELLDQREGFKNLELALEAIAMGTETPPTFTSSHAEELNSNYATKLKTLNDNLLSDSKDGVPNISDYLSKVTALTETTSSTDAAIAVLDQIDPTQGGTIDFSGLGITAETLATTKTADINAILTLANGNHTQEQLDTLIEQKTQKWNEIPTHLATLADYNNQMETLKANLLATETEDTPERRKLIRYADRIIAKTKTDATTRLNNHEFTILNSFESYFDFIANNDVNISDYPLDDIADTNS